jgi:hypothetical protein
LAFANLELPRSSRVTAFDEALRLWSIAMTIYTDEELYPSLRIRHAEIDGLIVVMDLEDEQYHILDERASVIWNEMILAGGNLNDAMVGVQTRLPGDVDRVQRNFQSFVSQCTHLGFLSAQQRPLTDHRSRFASGRPLSSWLPLRACWSLLLTGASLKFRGFRRTYEDLDTSAGRSPLVDSDSLLMEASQAFLWAENLVQFRKAPNDCVPRSLALFRFLWGIGLPVVHRIGGRRFPIFTMHAWVEYDGKAILDETLETEKDIILASLPSWISSSQPAAT